MTLTGRQIREARKLLGWGRLNLSRHVELSEASIAAIESSDGPAWLTDEQETNIRRTIEDFGVIFIETNGEGPEVRLRKGGAADDR